MASTTPPTAATWVSADKGDAAATLTVPTSSFTNVWDTTLTTPRAITLSTTGATNGARFRVVRTASALGAFFLNVGTGPLAALAAGEWCDVEYNGTAWFLAARGELQHMVGSPAQITANQNNYATLPYDTLRLNSDASRNITGLAGGADGRSLRIINVGSFDIVLQNQNAGSTDANKIITGTGADVTLAADDTAHLWYDGTTARWRIVGNY